MLWKFTDFFTLLQLIFILIGRKVDELYREMLPAGNNERKSLSHFARKQKLLESGNLLRSMDALHYTPIHKKQYSFPNRFCHFLSSISFIIWMARKITSSDIVWNASLSLSIFGFH